MIYGYSGSMGFWVPALAICVLALVVCVWKAEWRQLLARSERLHLWLGAIVFLALFWILRVDIQGLLALHPLLVMALCVVFGPALAIIAGFVATGLCLLLLSSSLLQWPLQGLINVLVPVLAAALILRLIERIPNRNLFVFLLGGGFFAPMITVQAMALAALGYAWLFGPDPLVVIVLDHYYLTWLMMFPEGFINGAVITTLTVLRPDLVKTYDDHVYLDDD